MEENNKYWLEEDCKICVFCRVGQDSIKHYIKECKEVKEWFNIFGVGNKEKYRKIWNDELEERIIKKLWKEKENRCVDYKYKCKYVNKRQLGKDKSSNIQICKKLQYLQ